MGRKAKPRGRPRKIQLQSQSETQTKTLQASESNAHSQSQLQTQNAQELRSIDAIQGLPPLQQGGSSKGRTLPPRKRMMEVVSPLTAGEHNRSDSGPLVGSGERNEEQSSHVPASASKGRHTKASLLPLVGDVEMGNASMLSACKTKPRGRPRKVQTQSQSKTQTKNLQVSGSISHPQSQLQTQNAQKSPSMDAIQGLPPLQQEGSSQGGTLHPWTKTMEVISLLMAEEHNQSASRSLVGSGERNEEQSSHVPASASKAMDHNKDSRPSSGGRGPTYMKDLMLIRLKRKKLKVEFDSKGRPLGKNGVKYRSYLSMSARSRVPIDIDHWDHVSQDIKDEIWEDVLTVFTGVEGRKHEESKYMGQRWRDFKSRLTHDYITMKPEGDVNPLEKYPFIDPDVWRNFVSSRETPEFQATSQSNRERRSKNLFPHRMSRGGYQKVEQALIKQKLAEAAKSGTPLPSSDIELPRHLTWKMGRVNSSGDYLTQESMLVAQKIDDMEQQTSQGSFTPSGRMDILAAALGKEEHPGRVRGVGGGVGIKAYFGPTSRRHLSMKDFEEFSAKVRAETRAEMEDMMEEKVMTMLQKMGVQVPTNGESEVPKAPLQSRNASCPLDHNQFAEILESGARCHLAVGDIEEQRIVAVGKVFNSRILHGRELPGNEVRVVIETPIDGAAILPVPSDEMSFVHEALGTYIAWPRRLVILAPEVSDHALSKGLAKEMKDSKNAKTNQSKNQPSPRKQPEEQMPNVRTQLEEQMPNVRTQLEEQMPIVQSSQLTRNCKTLYSIAKRMQPADNISTSIGAHISGFAYDLHVNKEDIMQILAMDELKASCISLFIKYLYTLCLDMGLADEYGFVCPDYTENINLTKQLRTTQREVATKLSKKRCFLAPFNLNEHWMLCAIYPKTSHLYWLDPLGDTPQPEFRCTVETYLKRYHVLGNVGKRGRKVEWIKVKCPRPEGNTKSGYYVMRYMFDMIYQMNVEDDNPRQLFEGDSDSPYTQQHIDEIRDLWADFLILCDSG